MRVDPSSHFSLGVLALTVFLSSLTLSEKHRDMARVVVTMTPHLLFEAMLAISFFRMRSLPSMADSIGPVCASLAWRSISILAISTFGSRAVARLIRPCSVMVDVLEETKAVADGKLYQALATA